MARVEVAVAAMLEEIAVTDALYRVGAFGIRLTGCHLNTVFAMSVWANPRRMRGVTVPRHDPNALQEPVHARGMVTDVGPGVWTVVCTCSFCCWGERGRHVGSVAQGVEYLSVHWFGVAAPEVTAALLLVGGLAT